MPTEPAGDDVLARPATTAAAALLAEPTRRCAGPCRQQLNVEVFPVNVSRPSGRSPYCRPCRALLERRRTKLRAMGRTPWVPADRARQHVQRLLDAGMTRHQIAEHAGRNRTVIRNLMVGQPHAGQGPATRLRRDTEAALLGVPVSPCAPAPVPPGRSRRAGALVDQTGTVRRLRALMANGWPARELARRLGCHTPSLQIKAGRRVTSSTAAAVRTLYEQLHDVAGPSPRTASLYRNRGYLTPGWWDQDTIDDPCYDPALEQLVTAAELDAQERAHWLLEVYRLTQRGLSAQDIASRTGTYRRRVVRARSRLRAVS